MSDLDSLPRYWSSALMTAVRSDDYTVELVDGDPGAQVLIDGVPMFDGSGYPTEQFNIACGNDYHRYLTDDGLDKLNEVNNE